MPGLAAGPPTGELLTNELIHNGADFHAAAPPQVRWRSDGVSFSALEPLHAAQQRPAAGASTTLQQRMERDERQLDSGEIGAGGLIEDRAVATDRLGAPEMELVSYCVATGDRVIVCSARQLTPAGHSRAVPVADYSWSEDGSKLLVFTNAQKVWRNNTRGDYFVVDILNNGIAEKVAPGQDDACQMYAKFSPDGQWVGWVWHNNLWVQRLSSGTVTQLTKDGLPGHGGMAPIINGNFDWAHEEELSLKDGWRWSPDSSRIAYWQLDTSGVQWFNIIDNTTATPYTTTMSLPYPKVGTQNSTSRIGVVAVCSSSSGGGDSSAGRELQTKWLDLGLLSASGAPAEYYLASLDWVNNCKLAVQRLSRSQTRVDVLLVDSSTGRSTVAFSDSDACWVDISPHMHWLDDESFVWLSDRSGTTRQVYIVTTGTGDGECMPLMREPLQPLDGVDEFVEVISVVSVDKLSKMVYFIGGNSKKSTERRLYSLSLDLVLSSDNTAAHLRQRPQLLTPQSSSDARSSSYHGGSHGYIIAPGGRWAVHTVSSFGVPPQVCTIK